MSLKKGQEVLLKRYIAKYGKVDRVVPDPDGGEDGVWIEPVPVCCRVSDLEILEALPTQEELKADYDRREAVFDNFMLNPSDPQRLQELLSVLRELGFLPKN